MNIIPFSQCNIYEFRLNKETTDKVYQDFKNSEIFWKKVFPSATTSAGYADPTFSIPWYNDTLFNWFDECLDELSKKHFSNKKLSIIDSWLTSASTGSYTHKHMHSCAVVSGLYYFTDHAHSETVFEYVDPWIQDIEWMFNPTEVAEYPKLQVKPESGKLLLWKSTFPHSVNMHRETKPRHTLAFNTFMDGKIGKSTTGFLDVNCVTVKQKYQKYLEDSKPNTIEK